MTSLVMERNFNLNKLNKQNYSYIILKVYENLREEGHAHIKNRHINCCRLDLGRFPIYYNVAISSLFTVHKETLKDSTTLLQKNVE